MTDFLLFSIFFEIAIAANLAISWIKRIEDALHFQNLLQFRHELERVRFREHVEQLYGVPTDSLWESGSDFAFAGDKDDVATQLKNYQTFRAMPDETQAHLKLAVDFVEQRVVLDRR